MSEVVYMMIPAFLAYNFENSATGYFAQQNSTKVSRGTSSIYIPLWHRHVPNFPLATCALAQYALRTTHMR